MGVRINVSKTFRTAVNFNLLTADGKQEAQHFTAEFKRLTREEVKDLIETSGNDADMLKQVMVGWSMKDLGSNEEVPFNDDTFAEFVSLAGAAGVTMLRFMETVGANRTKN